MHGRSIMEMPTQGSRYQLQQWASVAASEQYNMPQGCLSTCYNFFQQRWIVLWSEGWISEFFHKETVVEVFPDLLLSACLNLSFLISLSLPFRGRITSYITGKKKNKKNNTTKKKVWENNRERNKKSGQFKGSKVGNRTKLWPHRIVVANTIGFTTTERTVKTVSHKTVFKNILSTRLNVSWKIL